MERIVERLGIRNTWDGLDDLKREAAPNEALNVIEQANEES